MFPSWPLCELTSKHRVLFIFYFIFLNCVHSNFGLQRITKHELRPFGFIIISDVNFQGYFVHLVVNLTHTVQSDHFKPVIAEVRNTDDLVKFQCSGEKTLGPGNHVGAT